MSSELQLAMPLGGADNPDAATRAGIEAAVLWQEADRARSASWSRPCRCRTPFVDEDSCVLCGHEPIGVAA